MSYAQSYRVEALEVVYTVQQDWDGGFIAELAVTNDGAAPLDWTLLLDAGFEVTNLWRATATPVGDGGLRLAGPAWQPTLAPGETFVLGFEAAGEPDAALAITAPGARARPRPRPPTSPLYPSSTLELVDADPVREGGELIFTLALSRPAEEAVRVGYETVDGSARAGGDYVAATETVTIPAGESAAVIRVATRDGATIEPDETIGVRLTDVVGAEARADEARGVQVDRATRTPRPATQGIVLVGGRAGCAGGFA